MTLVVLMPLSSTAQVRIDVWTTDDGLPQNSVTGLTQTRDGYIWFTTNEGLVRFDGARFKVFNRSNTPEIRSNRMLGAFADRSGRIWMSTEEGDVLFLAAGRFHVARTPDNFPAGMPSRFFDAPSGGVIFYVGQKTYSDKKRYEHLHYRNGKLVPLEIEGLAEGSYLVLTDREGGLWFAGDGVLQRFKDGTMTSVDLGELGDGEFSRIAYEDHQGSVWVGHWGTNPLLLRIADRRVDRFPLPRAPVSSFVEDARGNLWISLLDHGVYRVDRSAVAADAPLAPLLGPVALADRIPDFSIGYLCADREGGVWVGTNRGLVHLSSPSIRVFSRGDGLPEENVYPVYEDSAGRIWAGIWQNTLARYEGGRFHAFLRTADTFYITSLFEDRSGRFWIGTASNLYYLDDTKLVRFTEPAGFAALAEFSVITQDREDALWFGTDQGLSRRAGGQVTRFTAKDGLPDDYITALLQTSDGRLWVGTRRGLAALASGHVTAFTTADGLASNHVRSLHEDSERVLWIGSYDGGLTRFKDGKFTALTVKEGLFSNGVFCILEDHRGWFWMNSNQGIFRVRKQQLNEIADGKMDSLTSIAYDKTDGPLTVEGNGGRQPAGVAARDGKLWFPTARGIAMVDPEEVTTNPIPPPVLIEEIVVDHAAVSADELQSALAERSAIVLRPDQANLEITYTGISFLNAGQVKFRYKLEGQDRDWLDVGTRRTAYYSYLRPGAYTFRAIAANRDGVWNTRGASVAIRVLPPFYATIWFITLNVAVLACLTWAAYRGRVHRLRQQEKKLRNVVETIPATTWTALPDGSVDFISQQWRECTGPSVAEAAGSGLQTTIHPDDAAQYVERWRASLATGTLFECEARFRRGADRKHRWFLARAVPLRDARGRILKWYGVLTDIEERKRAEAELEHLRQLQADLAHTNRVSLLGELTASLAHEVNQPITATITNASASLRWLARDQPDLDEARTAIKRIEQEARRTAEIVARVRFFYKKGAPPRRESVDLNQVVSEMLVLVRHEANRHSVVMRTECAPERPVVRADRVQVQQVLMNLMLNGIEAMEEGPGVLTIKTEAKDGHVLVAVSDDGVGLPANGLDRIFDSFFTTKADGTGMGLSISRSIIEAHGGRLWASDNEGGGATFHFTLPAEPHPPSADVRLHEA
jgi:PAS domain S-box-containing protein